MFQSVRPNSQIYILHKNNDPTLEIGNVVNQPTTRPKYQLTPSFGQPQEMIVDLVVKVGEQTVNFNSLPANADVSDSVSNGETIVISDSREALSAEVLSLKQNKIDVLNNRETDEHIIAKCDEILIALNPEYAEKQQQKKEMDVLNERVSSLSKNVEALMESNKLLIEKLTKKEI